MAMMVAVCQWSQLKSSALTNDLIVSLSALCWQQSAGVFQRSSSVAGQPTDTPSSECRCSETDTDA